jgi:hypothetical protein
MKNLKTFAALLVLLFVFSCEKETTTNELLNSNKELELKEFQSISEAVKAGFDFEAYRESLPVQTTKTKATQAKIVEEGSGLTFYTDEEEFGLDTCEYLSFEDFESSIARTQISMLGPLNEFTDNNIYALGDIQPGVNVFSDRLTGYSFDLHVHGQINGNTVVLATVFIETLIIEFDTEVYTASMNLYRWISSNGGVIITIFGESNNIIGSFNVNNVPSVNNVNPEEQSFFGVNSLSKIGKITIKSMNDNGYFSNGEYHDAEVIDNLRFGNCKIDTDGDGIYDYLDNCPDTRNKGQADRDKDGVGNKCDNCPDTPNVDQADSDGDGIGDACDNCPDNPSEDQSDNDDDGIGDICDSDDDNDKVLDIHDNCPKTFNPLQNDYDNDGYGDACDDDDDNDGRIDENDKYPRSNISSYLMLDCKNLIPNQLVKPGIMMNDEIQAAMDLAEAMEDVSDSRRTSKFRRKMYVVVNYWWYKYRLISSKEKRQILECVNQMSYPFER